MKNFFHHAFTKSILSFFAFFLPMEVQEAAQEEKIALNNMSSTAQDLVTNLEALVAERTRVIEKRVAQIQAATEVGKAVASQRDLEELLNRATHLISNRFGFYHVGIFLLDDRNEYAILRAANSKGGEQMLAREHRLRVGTEGIVGAVASSGEARIALDVGKDAVYFDNAGLIATPEVTLFVKDLVIGQMLLAVFGD